MKIGQNKSLLAIAMASVLAAPIAMADEDRDGDGDSDHYAESSKKEITFIHSGDFHGDFHPHVNGRADAPNAAVLEGGMARAVTLINEIRSDEENVIHVHTGDTIAGSATATFTKGDALVQMVDQLGIDVATPGNWEFSYGVYRYLQFFGTDGDIEPIGDNSSMAIKIEPSEEGLIPTYGAAFREVTYYDESTGTTRTAMNRWGMVAANVYENGTKNLDPGVSSKGVGKLLTPPYRIITKDGVKIGFIGCTTNRGPQVVSSTITTGVAFTNCKGEVKFPQNRPIKWANADAATVAANMGTEKNPTIPTPEGGDKGHVTKSEIEKWTKYLRDVEGVDLVAVMSEAGIAENIYAAENLGQGDATWNGPDIYFSSDMHEETNQAVIVTDPNGKKVIIVENSEDIAQIGELEIEVIKTDGKYRIAEWEYKAHDILDHIAEDSDMADLVDQVDAEMAAMIASGNAVNPYNGHKLEHQLSDTVGTTDMIIERNRFSNEHDPANKVMPAVIEGTGHALITDAFRVLTNSQVGGIRGFRYTNTVLPGDQITWGLLYHYMPIGPQVATAAIPTTASSEPAPTVDNDGDGRIWEDNADNKRHFLGWPRSLQQEMELSGNSTMNPIIFKWGGGWVFNYSGVKFDFKPTGKNFNKYGKALSARVSNMMLTGGDNNPANDTAVTNALGEKVTYASYYYDEDHNRINRNQIVTGGQLKKYNAANGTSLTLRQFASLGNKIQVLAKDNDGNLVMATPQAYADAKAAGKMQVVDAVEALARYIEGGAMNVYNWNAVAMAKGDVKHVAQGLGGNVVAANFEFPRINLVNDAGNTENTLVDCTAEFGSPCIEPFRGAEGAVTNGNVTLPGNYIKGVADAPADEGNF